jgi:hypothetical protein
MEKKEMIRRFFTRKHIGTLFVGKAHWRGEILILEGRATLLRDTVIWFPEMGIRSMVASVLETYFNYEIKWTDVQIVITNHRYIGETQTRHVQYKHDNKAKRLWKR